MKLIIFQRINPLSNEVSTYKLICSIDLELDCLIEKVNMSVHKSLDIKCTDDQWQSIIDANPEIKFNPC